MDIYNFINSKAIAKHCRNINHQFNSIEVAYLVHFNKVLTVKEKHQALNEIIDTMPDMEIKKRMNCPHYDSLHQFLRDYMALENKILDRFKTDETDAVYDYSTYYVDDDGFASNDDRLFVSLEDVFKAVKEENKNNDICKYRIQKRWLGEKPKYIYVDFTMNQEPVAIGECGFLTDIEDKLLLAFEGMWFEIPTPFKEGDIVIDSMPFRCPKESFVLSEICYWCDDKRRKHYIENADFSDMTAYGYWVDGDGRIYWECMHTYQNLEYYQGELKGIYRPLITVSNFLKGKISLTLLINAYHIILDEERVRQNKKHIGYTEEYEELAGLKSVGIKK